MLAFIVIFICLGSFLHAESQPATRESSKKEAAFCIQRDADHEDKKDEDQPKKEEKKEEEKPNNEKDKPEKKDPPRRALPAPFADYTPPFPSAEYQGYPLVGVPYDDTFYPLEQSIYDTCWGEYFKEKRVRFYGWANASGNLSSCRHSNLPTSYWIQANNLMFDQFVFRIERQVDSVQTDYIDVGFRSTYLYGTDYRFMTAGGWTSWQLLKENKLYGYDFTEQYLDIYYPWFAQGLILRIGRWIACPDIETQFAPDNYLGSHSILFTYDTYTQTGVMATVMLNKYWTVQACIHCGTDMAPWYPGAVATGMFGVRWVSCDNNDSIYLVLNSINAAKFRRFKYHGQKAGHDNFNYLVGTWQHRFTERFQTRTEAYFMWQRDAVVGGTPSIGPVRSFGGGGGIGPDIPGTTLNFGVLNYTMYAFSKTGFFTLRNEYWRDVDGERSGFKGTYSSHTIGFTFNLTPLLQFRPEIGYYYNWINRAFDLGRRKGLLLFGADITLRF